MPSSLKSDIVVGIDFGTTQGRKKIRLITDWPNPEACNANSDKVPSVIAYQDGLVSGWGYEVSTKAEAFRWIKLLLEPEYKHANVTQQVLQSNKLLKKLNKRPEDVVSDYLRQIWEYTKEDIRKHVGDNSWESTLKVHIVLTVPAMWSHAAKDKTLEAARRASLPDGIRLVTEPEAAALATLHDKAQDHALTKGDAFVVCDAGGGTVDLISYKTLGLDPLRIEECAVGEGGLCGSVFLDLAFERYIKMIVGQEQYGTVSELNKKRMLKDFEFGVKRCFTVESKKDYSVDLRGVKDDFMAGIIDETINLKQSMLRTVFDQVCEQIVRLVQNQMTEIRSNDLAPKAILLVGGFGSSKYLHHRLESSYTGQDIVVLQIEGAWSAVCRGACIWGLEQVDRPKFSSKGSSSTVTVRISRYNYGVLQCTPFDPDNHLAEDRFFHEARNTYYADNQMEWLLRRGDKITDGRTLTRQLCRSVHGICKTSKDTQTFSDTLYSCQDPEPPTRLDATAKELCSIRYTIQESTIFKEKPYTSPAKPGEFRDLSFDFDIILGATTLDFQVRYHNKTLATVQTEYADAGN
ncbi:hypothetical protein HIM_10776 [Hirsutella minnesotensis 3608]|uniref:Uncharacterized protein n=1 Tax=Hirsutella minnesotensis 3608 TaxID=1043627 RepID=A0A0F7ZRL5_9HYPO|nr:hypothetical protein HIM_10776 [Hirsutella minnesotensis 3608]